MASASNVRKIRVQRTCRHGPVSNAGILVVSFSRSGLGNSILEHRNVSRLEIPGCDSGIQLVFTDLEVFLPLGEEGTFLLILSNSD